MVATLRVMLDQLVAPSEPELVEASRELARALVVAAPSGCEVEAIAPAGGVDGALDAVPGLAGVRRTALPRRELAAALQLGVGTGIGGGRRGRGGGGRGVGGGGGGGGRGGGGGGGAAGGGAGRGRGRGGCGFFF